MDRLACFTSHVISLLFGALCLFSSIVYSMENRTALVIGNAAYRGLPVLYNPVNDAEDMATKLRKLGFEVIYRSNVSKRSMRDAMRQFGTTLKRKRGVGLFYYAGHGVQVGGENYLVPINADLQAAYDVPDQAISANYVLEAMKAAGNDMNIIILDACRDNPFVSSTRSVSRGLARMNAPRGSLIAYATAPGNTTLDGEGRNGLYTKYLLKYINQPGLTLEQVFKRVRVDVERETTPKPGKPGRKQTPWEESSLRGDFYFIDQVIIEPSKPNTELEFWNNIKNTDNPAYFQAYIEQYGDQGWFTRIAKIKRAELKQSTRKPQPAPIPTIKTEPMATRRSFEPEMVKIRGGTFNMGSPKSEAQRYSNERLHSVQIDDFWMGKTEVTFAQYDVFAEKTGRDKPDDEGWGRGNRPVINVSWDDAVAHAHWLSQVTGKPYRLPTEAEWEYAARAGTTTAFSFGETISPEQVNYDGNYPYIGENKGLYRKKTVEVQSLPANPWGLYEMHGNVREWTCSRYDKTYGGGEQRCAGSSSGVQRVLRGGSWFINGGYCRSAVRYHNSAFNRFSYNGFRFSLGH